ncbi:SIR2 family transcriptional regulator (macronuclear) [Tetrahymena thermophila SB210]|uniref:SIR2 family transcriptional regulator n=1 Tax=Tetrahymena thermophila (strain SB210) TaxID=312017 RepID=Q23YS7_TETTS|nr:SIR2 family transcriptional regulator [Tetrahymena thermophila SB210]EAS01728.2 SIR2 family transcriptional regulator [Tetrahymena thermophila SB210]|eukprot:XP_001021973.2 SIR2 family transcriptional regulator [Tetrahymena thermophila SB210]
MQTNLHQLIAKRIQSASCLIITAGAGMGVDSGLPDFRGKEGFWNNYIPFRNKFSFTECANPQFLLDHPNLFWGFYGHRLHLYRETQPHKGFGMLKTWSQNKKSFVLTSNVDGHFQKAGFDNKSVYEVHGSINFMQCTSCQRIYSADGYNIIYDMNTFEAKDPLPNCKNCVNVIVRPNILMFGDYSFMSDRVEEQEDRYLQFKNQLTTQDRIIVLEFGAGEAVATIRMMGEELFLKYKHITFIRVNPRDDNSPFGWKQQQNTEDKAFYALKQGALEAITQIQQYML